MKKLIRCTLFVSILGSAGWSGAVASGVPIGDTAEIAGAWLLVATALRRDGERQEENSEWDFRSDGRLVTTGYNYAANRVMIVEDSYKVIDGMIVTGQGGKYAVVQRSEKEMVLKGPFGFYFFTRE